MRANRRKRNVSCGPSWKIALVVVAAACSGRMSREETAAFSECKRFGGSLRADCFARRGGVAACRRAAITMAGSECFSAVAAAKKQVELCDEIASVQDRVDCVKGVADKAVDAKLCARIEAPRYRDECVEMVAMTARDASVCDLVGNPFRRDTCRENKGYYFLDTACPHIEDANRRDACYLHAAQSHKGSIDLCDKVVGRKAECLVELAKDHPEVCERVGSGPTSIPRTRCYDAAFGIGSGRRSCAGMTDRAQLPECETRLALQAKDSATCTAMLTREGAETCWNAVGPSDGVSCLEIRRPDFQRECLRRYWIRAKDARICSSLKPAALSQACAARFGQEGANRSARR